MLSWHFTIVKQKNENGIREIGTKGMRVFDFGWNKTNVGWKEKFIIDIIFQMHATDLDLLEQILGVPDSQGCVRIHSSFNKFLDKHYEENLNFKWDFRKNKTPVVNAGSFLPEQAVKLRPLGRCDSLLINTSKNPKDYKNR